MFSVISVQWEVVVCRAGAEKTKETMTQKQGDREMGQQGSHTALGHFDFFFFNLQLDVKRWISWDLQTNGNIKENQICGTCLAVKTVF